MSYKKIIALMASLSISVSCFGMEDKTEKQDHFVSFVTLTMWSSVASINSLAQSLPVHELLEKTKPHFSQLEYLLQKYTFDPSIIFVKENCNTNAATMNLPLLAIQYPNESLFDMLLKNALRDVLKNPEEKEWLIKMAAFITDDNIKKYCEKVEKHPEDACQITRALSIITSSRLNLIKNL